MLEVGVHTWMVDNGQLAVGLLDIQPGSRGLDTKGVVVGGIDDHFPLLLVLAWVFVVQLRWWCRDEEVLTWCDKGRTASLVAGAKDYCPLPSTVSGLPVLPVLPGPGNFAHQQSARHYVMEGQCHDGSATGWVGEDSHENCGERLSREQTLNRRFW